MYFSNIFAQGPILQTILGQMDELDGRLDELFEK